MQSLVSLATVLMGLTGDVTGDLGVNSLSGEPYTAVGFTLHTRNTPAEGGQLYTGDGGGLSGSDFLPQRPTILLAHGWLSSKDSDSVHLIVSALLKTTDVNVVVVDWGTLAGTDYYTASSYVTHVGRAAAEFINFLVMHGGARTTDMQFVGFSLGAHVAGIAGSSITTGMLGSVRGLDPASPSFGNAVLDERLDKGDANHVEVIHTNAGVLGWVGDIGHVSFYPNGGTTQPGCSVFTPWCSHGRAYEYFAESIVSEGFQGTRCKSYLDWVKGLCQTEHKARMGGLWPDITAAGRYFLNTTAESPFNAEELEEATVIESRNHAEWYSTQISSPNVMLTDN